MSLVKGFFEWESSNKRVYRRIYAFESGKGTEMNNLRQRVWWRGGAVKLRGEKAVFSRIFLGDWRREFGGYALFIFWFLGFVEYL